MDSNIKSKTIKLLQKDIGENLWDIELVKEFLDLVLKTKSIKGKYW